MFPHRKGDLANSPGDLQKVRHRSLGRCLHVWISNEALLPSRPLGARLSRQTGRQQNELRAAPFFVSCEFRVVVSKKRALLTHLGVTQINSQ